MVTVMDGPESGPFNIGNPTEFTMLELAQMVQQVVNPNVKIVYKENTADDPSRRKPDITKVMPTAYTLLYWLCWQPRIVSLWLCSLLACSESFSTCACNAAAYFLLLQHTPLVTSIKRKLHSREVLAECLPTSLLYSTE